MIAFFNRNQQYLLLHDRGPYHIETSPLICIANHSKMIGTFAMKELKRVVLVV